MATTKRTFVFDLEDDADIIAALDALDSGEKSGVVRAALREYFQLQKTRPAEPTMANVVERLDRLQDDIAWLRQNGVAAKTDSPGDDDDDDPALMEALLGLGL